MFKVEVCLFDVPFSSLVSGKDICLDEVEVLVELVGLIL